ncbi:HAD family hydrolase [Microlunatus parietis]|uniref:Putative hydrolase of the HAD superfamily n=1 Tax=Microlunatus parietis TaxID=682979 RepID=A0A7Y9L9Y2_9ACTN|nr:HAD-IA family hydrolase [Microlunatus parietis]NYE69075.1 putative hydrolase of the HAD superfamily [Microlunatus parietis]
MVFDLFETLVTEFDPEWKPGPSPASRLGVSDEVFDHVWQSRHSERMTRVVDFRDVLREICATAAREADAAVIQALYSERLAAKAKPFLSVDGRVLEALNGLRARGLKLGLVSNCSVEEVAAWATSPLAPLFDCVVFSYQAGVAKPAAAIFQIALDELELPPGRVAFVGDGGSDELAGAARVGMSPHCAMWFLNQWPVGLRERRAERRLGFPALSSPADLPTVVGDGS